MLSRKNVIVLTPDRNTPKSDGTPQKDFTGAFLPESKLFCQLHNVPESNVFRIDPTLSYEHRVEKIMGAMMKVAAAGQIDAFVAFCHGWPFGIQAGLRRSDLPQFCRVWGPHMTKDVVVALYCCSTGDGEGDQRQGPGGDGGFADTFRDSLCIAGNTDCAVFSHTTVGHTTANPYVRVFRGRGLPVAGGNVEFLVDPTNSARFPKWRKVVAEENKNAWRLKYPFMSAEEIEAALQA